MKVTHAAVDVEAQLPHTPIRSNPGASASSHRDHVPHFIAGAVVFCESAVFCGCGDKSVEVCFFLDIRSLTEAYSFDVNFVIGISA